jgi:hypothetical protein
MPATYNFTLYQGDNYILNFTVDGDYSAYTHTMALAVGLEAGVPALVLTSPANISATYDALTDKTSCIATFATDDTGGLDAEVIYYYDYQVESGATVQTLLNGTIAVQAQVAE